MGKPVYETLAEQFGGFGRINLSTGSLVQYFADELQLAAMVYWGFGDLGGATWRENTILMILRVCSTERKSRIYEGFDIVLLGRRLYMGFNPSEKDIRIVNEILKKSGGELQKVSIARALAQEPEILLMDEPTNNLDPKNQLKVMEIAKDFAKVGKVSIAVMHDVNLALRFADRFIFMKNGRIIADGGREILRSEIFEKVYGIRGLVGEVSGVPVFIASSESWNVEKVFH